MERSWALPTTLLLVCVALGFVLTKKTPTSEKPFDGVSTKVLLDPHTEKPAIWIYYNNSDVNSRFWSDFGSRSSRVLNKTYLNLCYESIVKAAKNNYRIEIIKGLDDAVKLLGGIEFMPSPLRNSKTILLEEEVNFLSIAILARFGGLWINPSTICIREIPILAENSIIAFGTSDTESYSGPDGTIVPNTQLLWAPKPNTPMFLKWASLLYERLDGYGGGQRVRRDNQWDWLYVTTGACGVQSQPNATVQRKENGKRIEIEDLLAAGTEGNLPFPIGSEAIFVPIPYYELERRSAFGWFLRMSEEQIMESDLAIKYLFEEGISQV